MADLSTVAKQVLADWQRGKLPFFVLPPGCEPPPPSHRATKATAIAIETDQCNITESRSGGTEAVGSPAGSEGLVNLLSEPGELEGEEQGLDEDEDEDESEDKESTAMPPRDASGDEHEADEDDEFKALGRLLADASPDTDTESGSDADVDHSSPSIKDRSCTASEIPTRKPRRVLPAPAKRASFGRIKPAVATKKSSKYKNSRGFYQI